MAEGKQQGMGVPAAAAFSRRPLATTDAVAALAPSAGAEDRGDAPASAKAPDRTIVAERSAHANHQQLLLEVTSALIGKGLDEAALGRIVFERIALALQADVCFSYRTDPKRDGIELVYYSGISSEQAEAARKLQLDQAFCGTVASTGQPLAADARMIASDSKAAFVAGMGLRAYACHPIRAGDGRVLGTFSLGSTTRDGFPPESIALLQTVTNFLAQAWERLASERELESREQFSRAVLEASPDCLKVIDASGRLRFMNANGRALMEIDDFSMCAGALWQELWPGPERARVAAAVEAAKAGRQSRFEAACPTAKGTPKWWDVMVSPVRDPQGRVTEIVSTSRDITQRKTAELALQAGAERLRLATTAAGMLVYDVDVTRRFATKIVGLDRLTGHSEEERSSDWWHGLIHPEDREAHLARVELHKSGGRYSSEYRVRHADGRWIWVHDDAEVLLDAHGAPLRMVGTITDITARKQTEERLRQREADLTRAHRLASLGSYEVGLCGGFHNRRSPEYLRIHGLGPDDWDEPHEAWVARIHPDDRERAETAFKQAVLDGATIYTNEYRIRRKSDGETRWLSVLSEIDCDADGSPVRLFGVHMDITDRKRAEEALRESEARFRALFTAIDEGYCLCEMILDGEGRAADYRFLEVNPLFEAMTGLAAPVGRSALELVPGLERHWIETYARVGLGGETLRFQQSSEVMGRHFDVFATPVEPKGRFALVFKDVTSRMRAEANLAFLATLGESLAPLSASVDIAETAARHIARHFAASRVNFSDVSAAGDEVTVYAGEREPGLLEDRITHRLDSYLAPSAIADLAAGRAVAVEDIVRDPRTAPHAEPYAQWDIGSVLLAPYRDEGRWRFMVAVHKPSSYAWRIDEIELLHEVSARVHIRLERARAEQATREALRLVENVMAAAPVSIHLFDLESGRNEIANQRTGVLLGLEGTGWEQTLPQLRERMHPDDLATLPEYRQRLEATRTLEPVEREFRLRHADGTWRWFLSRDIPYERDAEGHLRKVLGIAVDITERKEIELALRDREEHLRLVLDSSSAVTFDWDIPADRVRRLFSSEPALPETIDGIFEGMASSVHPDDEQMFRANVRAGLENREGDYRSEHRVVRPDGQVRWLLERGRVTHDRDGRPLRLLGISFDITERRQAEDALAEQRRLYKTVTDNAAAALFIMDERQQCVFMNPAAERLTGYTLDEVTGRPLHDVVHHTRPDGSHYPLSECPIDQALPKNDREQGEEVFVHKDGHFYDVAFTASPLRDASGDPVGTIVEVRDITARKRAEAALRDSEERFRTIVDTAQEGIWVADRQGATVVANPRMAALLGTTPAAMKDRPVFDYCFEEDHDEIRGRMAASLKGIADEFELRFRRADGSALHVLAATAPFRGSGGEIIGAIGGFVDLSERKKAEERQRVLMREIAHRGKNLLAVVQSIAARTLTGDRPLAAAKQAFIGRLQALSRTYSSLTDEVFEGALLDEIVRSELRPYGGRAHIAGPKVMLHAKVAQTFALIVHELATNAAKYGGLSAKDGHLDVTWQLAGDRNGRRLAFEWIETGGPPARPPSRQGFGTTLITTVAMSELKCVPAISYADSGLRYRLDMPLDSVGTAIEELPVRDKLRSDAMRGFFDAWVALRGTQGRPPRFSDFPRHRFSASGGLTVAEIDRSRQVQLVEIGQALTERLGEVFGDGEIPQDDLETLLAAYRRCARGSAPCYEHLRFDFGDGHVVTFERLLLPFAQSGSRLTHIAGLVVYSGDTSPARPESR